MTQQGRILPELTGEASHVAKETRMCILREQLWGEILHGLSTENTRATIVQGITSGR
jgi:hypothetical protein